MNLIANSGIQFCLTSLDLNLDDNFKMYFHEWFDIEEEELKLEIAHQFVEDDKWVKKRDLATLGYLTDGKVGRIENDKFIPYKWDEIMQDFINEGKQPIKPMDNDVDGSDCFQMTINKCRLEKFENCWLPFPFFKSRSNGESDFGPINWCRIKLIPHSNDGKKTKYNLLLSFDTRTIYENENYEDEDLNETPIFSSAFDKLQNFTLCKNEFSIVDFSCSKLKKCDWVDEYVFRLFYPDKKNINDLKAKKPKLSYLAQYIFFINYIRQLNLLPTITLYSDKNAELESVDLVVDVGNSRTCAVLFNNSDFTKAESLSLFNFSNPVIDGRFNIETNPFDMRLVFRETDFGGNMITGSSQFIFPSMVRLGKEANELMHNAINLSSGVEKTSSFSSPKRYLWDNGSQQKEWEFITLNGEPNKTLWIKGVSEQLNLDGSLNTDGNGAIVQCYSRKSLMTLSFLEILAQAKMQVNSYEFRHRWGNQSTPRKIGRIIITCPSAMSREEQYALRKCAEDAAIILHRFYSSTYNNKVDILDMQNDIHVVPSYKNLTKKEEGNCWIYDEATASQFVYLYAEITKRYRNNCKEFFEFYGNVRKDIKDYNNKSLTIGSVDIGAGTTDVMVAAYKYEDTGKCRLIPIPLFWESFYTAGDDLMKDLIRNIIIEGKESAIPRQLDKLGRENIGTLILDYFGKDNARQTITDRQIRSEFNLQVSIPVIMQFLEILGENKIEKATLNFSDIFNNNNPSERVLNHFAKHFGFSIESMEWIYDKAYISKLVEGKFDSLTGKISSVLSYYGCDIVLLSGRPTSLKPLADLFLKYYAVSPNRLITLSEYRIGTWYPFQNGQGYFKDAKSIVAVGAMIGNYASSRGGLDGFSLDLNELEKKMLPTTEYFTKSENDIPFITPELNNAIIEVAQLPMQIWTRQLNTKSYPTRPFYKIDFNRDYIKNRMIDKNSISDADKQTIKNAVDVELERLQKLIPFKFKIVRENYSENKELLKIESVEDCYNNNLPEAYFSLHVQSMSESDNYWLDTGEFINLKY